MREKREILHRRCLTYRVRKLWFCWNLSYPDVPEWYSVRNNTPLSVLQLCRAWGQKETQRYGSTESNFKNHLNRLETWAGDDRMWGVKCTVVLCCRWGKCWYCNLGSHFLPFFFKQNILCNGKGVALLYGQGGWDRKQFSVRGKVRARHENMLISQCDMGMGVQRDVSGMKRKTLWWNENASQSAHLQLCPCHSVAICPEVILMQKSTGNLLRFVEHHTGMVFTPYLSFSR